MDGDDGCQSCGRGSTGPCTASATHAFMSALCSKPRFKPGGEATGVDTAASTRRPAGCLTGQPCRLPCRAYGVCTAQSTSVLRGAGDDSRRVSSWKDNATSTSSATCPVVQSDSSIRDTSPDMRSTHFGLALGQENNLNEQTGGHV